MACEGSWPASDHRIADLGRTTAYLHDDQFFPGWTVLVLKRHATELFDLEALERAAVLDEVAEAGRALFAAFAAIKINYALLGNVVPHIHWHVIPRLASEPQLRDPVWAVAHAPLTLDAERRQARMETIRAHLRR
jgi:diadenosine tetraphosphate (Ap4A) HIT family hydrolase